MFLYVIALFIQGLKVTMKKHPSAFKLCGELAEKLKTVQDTSVTLYEGMLLSSNIPLAVIETFMT